VAADKTHRRHAVIEKVHADLKSSALAHLPSGVFTANAARLATSARRLHLHLPTHWPWRAARTELFHHACGPPPSPAT